MGQVRSLKGLTYFVPSPLSATGRGAAHGGHHRSRLSLRGPTSALLRAGARRARGASEGRGERQLHRHIRLQ
eukprot:6412657-Pyramimonas_sp.AAC.1